MWHRLLHPRGSGFIPTAIYTFPSKEDVEEFSKARAKPMFQASPLLSQEVADLDSAGVKQGKSGWTVYFRGTFTQRAALSVPAGMLIHDELDRSDQDTLQMYRDRLRNSEDPHRFVFSTPTVPDFGVSAEWKRSDQSEWFWACPECRHEQCFAPMDGSVSWRDGLDLEEGVFRCVGCGVPISHDTVMTGRWVPQAAENAATAGYHITAIMHALSTAESLAEELEKSPNVDRFVQGALGVPQVSGENAISEDAIAFGDWPNTLVHPGPNYAGLDQGKKLDFVAGDGKGKIVAVHRFDDWSQVHSAMRTLNVRMLVGDIAPDARPMQELCRVFPGRVLMADYSLKTSALGGDKVYERVEKEPRVRIHRTAALDWTRDRILLKEDVFPAVPLALEREVKAHITAPKRTQETDSQGIPVSVWRETGPDHIRHAHLYSCVAGECGAVSAGGISVGHMRNPSRNF